MGIMVLEYGCKDEEPTMCSESSEMFVTGISEMQYVLSDGTDNFTDFSGNKASYSNLRYRLMLDWRLAGGVNYTNYAAYAVAPPYAEWTPAGIDITEKDGTSALSKFTIDGYATIDEYLESNGPLSVNHLDFKLLEAPASEQQKTYTFKFWHRSGMDEIETRPIVITR